MNLEASILHCQPESDFNTFVSELPVLKFICDKYYWDGFWAHWTINKFYMENPK